MPHKARALCNIYCFELGPHLPPHTHARICKHLGYLSSHWLHIRTPGRALKCTSDSQASTGKLIWLIWVRASNEHPGLRPMGPKRGFSNCNRHSPRILFNCRCWFSKSGVGLGLGNYKKLREMLQLLIHGTHWVRRRESAHRYLHASFHLLIIN